MAGCAEPQAAAPRARRAGRGWLIAGFYVALALALDWPILEWFNRPSPPIGPLPPFVFWMTVCTLAGTAGNLLIGLFLWQDAPDPNRGEP